MTAINLDKGVTKRMTGAGLAVCMYKDEPGVYRDVNGDRLDIKVAAEAGFDVRAIELDRRKREALALAQADVDREFAAKSVQIKADIDKQFAGEMPSEPAPAPGVPVSVAAPEGATVPVEGAQQPIGTAPEPEPTPLFKIEYRGAGWFNIVNLDGEAVNDKALKREELTKSMRALGITVDDEMVDRAIRQFDADKRAADVAAQQPAEETADGT